MIDQSISDIGSKYSTPMFKTPFTDLFLHVRNIQCRKECAPYELMYIDCMEAYGYHIGKEKCRAILNDMHECVFRVKRLRRVVAMHTERARQYKNGERKEFYPQGPPLDLY